MSASSYDVALARLLVHEGGYTNDAADPGGPTNFGITIADYRKYVKPNASAADVRAMKVEQAKSIYRSRYWDAQRCDELPAGVDDTVFDYGVNSGIGRAKKVLQRVVGVTADGVLGPDTMREVGRRDPVQIIGAVNDERLRFLQSLRTWPVFGKGWARRVVEVRAFSLQLAAAAAAQPAAGTAPVPSSSGAADSAAQTAAPILATPIPLPAPSPEVEQAGKGVVPLAAPLAAAVAHKNKIASTGLAGGSAGTVTWWDWMQAHPYEATAIVAGGVLIVGGIGFIIEQIHKATQEAP
ncbi:MAG: glycoside hydrolase family 108 protein, partial [Pseudolabrys sp.]